jgi:hypothetical protein
MVDPSVDWVRIHWGQEVWIILIMDDFLRTPERIQWILK